MSMLPLGGMFGGMSDVYHPQQPQSGGMFGGDIKGKLQTILASYLASQGNAAGALFLKDRMEQKHASRQAQAEQMEYDRKRQDEMTDWRAKQDYSSAHPNYGEFEQRLIASGVRPGTPEWTKANAAAVQNVTDPVVMTPQGPMLRSQVMGALQQPEILQSLPPGAKPIGGQSVIPTGPFPNIGPYPRY